MSETDYYEIVRQKIKLDPLYTPKNKKIFDLMKVFWNIEEIKILSHFPDATKSISVEELAEKTGLSDNKLIEILDRLDNIGTINKTGNEYGLITLLPGIFEKYFIHKADSEENLKKAAELFGFIKNNLLPHMLLETGFKLFRPLLPYDSEEKLIEIDETLDVEQEVLSYELVKQMIDNNDTFAVLDCQCRLIAELNGNPCKIAPKELGCFLVGISAKIFLGKGLARELSKEEAIEFIKKTEKAGLIHNCISDKSRESSAFICNCCSCCCGVLSPAKKMGILGVDRSNFLPRFDMEICKKCELCLQKCPNEAIYHKWPDQSDNSDEKMIVREDKCMGCGVCAANCPNDAIKMVKVRNEIPKKKLLIGNKSFSQLII
ncbi:MAG: ATP-binding protein [Promethearchaeota archaeon]